MAYAAVGNLQGARAGGTRWGTLVHQRGSGSRRVGQRKRAEATGGWGSAKSAQAGRQAGWHQRGSQEVPQDSWHATRAGGQAGMLAPGSLARKQAGKELPAGARQPCHVCRGAGGHPRQAGRLARQGAGTLKPAGARRAHLDADVIGAQLAAGKPGGGRGRRVCVWGGGGRCRSGAHSGDKGNKLCLPSLTAVTHTHTERGGRPDWPARPDWPTPHPAGNGPAGGTCPLACLAYRPGQARPGQAG